MPMIVLSKSAILMVAIGKTKAPIAPPLILLTLTRLSLALGDPPNV